MVAFSAFAISSLELIFFIITYFQLQGNLCPLKLCNTESCVWLSEVTGWQLCGRKPLFLPWSIMCTVNQPSESPGLLAYLGMFLSAENKASHRLTFWQGGGGYRTFVLGSLSVWIWPCPAGPDDSLPCREGESLPDSPHEWPWSRKWWSTSSWFGRSLRWTSRPESGR